MTLVVDASVALKWFVDEDGSPGAVSLLNSGEPMIAPDLVVAEVCNAGWKSLRRREIDAAQFDEIAADVSRVFVRLVSLDQLIRRAAVIARELDHAIYDCLYLALAEAEEVAMVTADRRLLAAVRGTALADRVSLLGRLAER
jgi:predicted nucleic acid-binding protein